MMLILFTSLILFASISADQNKNVQGLRLCKNTSKTELYVTRSFDWMNNKILQVIDNFLINERIGRPTAVEGRRKKIKKHKLSKYTFPLLLGLLLIKSTVIPLVLKALAILSGKAIMLSLLSLILSAIIGLRYIASGQLLGVANRVDVAPMPVPKYRRRDQNQEESIDEELYKYHAEKKKKRKR